MSAHFTRSSRFFQLKSGYCLIKSVYFLKNQSLITVIIGFHLGAQCYILSKLLN